MTTRDKLTFVHSMARSTRATVRQCEALLRYAGTLTQLANMPKWTVADEHKRIRIETKITNLVTEIALLHPNSGGHYSAVTSNDPAGPALKIRTPGGEEIEVPS